MVVPVAVAMLVPMPVFGAVVMAVKVRVAGMTELAQSRDNDPASKYDQR